MEFEDFKAEVELEYRLLGHHLKERLIEKLFYGISLLLFDPDDPDNTQLPFIGKTVLKSPYLKRINIPLIHLTEEFSTKSVKLPKSFMIKIIPGELNWYNSYTWEYLILPSPVKKDAGINFDILGKFTGVTNLMIDNIYNESLGTALSKLKNLKLLTLNFNKMDKVPDWIYDLDLEYLNLRHTHIKEYDLNLPNCEVRMHCISP